MKCFKFVIPVGDWRPCPTAPGVSFAGCAAVVFAETRERAAELLQAAVGETPSWVELATVTEIDTAVAQVALRAQL